MKETTIALAVLIFAVGIAVAFNVWLDSGCELQGAITWQGKICLTQ